MARLVSRPEPVSTTFEPPLTVRRGSDSQLLPTALSALAESRAGVAKAWLLRAIESAPLDQIERLPVGRIASDLPSLVGYLVLGAGRGALAAGERAMWIDRLGALRDDDSGPGLVRDLGLLHEAMLQSLERQAAALDASELVRAAARLATVFADLQADAAERASRSAGSIDDLLAGADRLTGLHGQDYLNEHLRHLVSMQKRYDQPFSVLLIDVEGLKRINQAWGQTAGDETLVGIAGAVDRTVRTADTTVRMAEDEFCVLLPNQTAGRARTAAERLAAAVEEVRDPSGGGLRIAVGVVACPQHAATTDELLELADAALYRAKAAGQRVAVGPEEYETDDE